MQTQPHPELGVPAGHERSHLLMMDLDETQPVLMAAQRAQRR
jgi:hypothetical protein